MNRLGLYILVNSVFTCPIRRSNMGRSEKFNTSKPARPDGADAGALDGRDGAVAGANVGLLGTADGAGRGDVL
jgi:hypothetical protein